MQVDEDADEECAVEDIRAEALALSRSVLAVLLSSLPCHSTFTSHETCPVPLAYIIITAPSPRLVSFAA